MMEKFCISNKYFRSLKKIVRERKNQGAKNSKESNIRKAKKISAKVAANIRKAKKSRKGKYLKSNKKNEKKEENIVCLPSSCHHHQGQSNAAPQYL